MLWMSASHDLLDLCCAFVTTQWFNLLCCIMEPDAINVSDICIMCTTAWLAVASGADMEGSDTCPRLIFRWLAILERCGVQCTAVLPDISKSEAPGSGNEDTRLIAARQRDGVRRKEELRAVQDNSCSRLV